MNSSFVECSVLCQCWLCSQQGRSSGLRTSGDLGQGTSTNRRVAGHHLVLIPANRR